MPSVIQPSFARGEIAPALHGRVDQSLYYIALKIARNVIVHAYGGVSNRPGLKYVGNVKYHDEGARLLPFKFKATDAYIIEAGHEYMRFIRQDGHITETPLPITGATQANPVVITSVGHGLTNGDDVFIEGVGGMTQLNQRWFTIDNVTADTFELYHQADVSAIDGTGYTAYTSDGTAAKIYEIATPYDFGDLWELKYVQSADTMTITHPRYDTKDLTRAGHDDWTMVDTPFVPQQEEPTAVAVSVNGTAGTTTLRYAVTALNGDGTEESLTGRGTGKTITGITQANPAVVTATSHGFLDGDEVEIQDVVGMTELNGRRFRVANKTADTFELEDEDSTAYTAWSSGGTAYPTSVRITNSNDTAPNNTVTWTPPTGPAVDSYSVYRDDFGTFAFVGETQTLSFTDDNIDPDSTLSSPRYRQPFFGDGNKPGAVGYYQQRRCYGGTTNKPDTTYYSQTGNFSNMTAASPAQADDAITATLASREVNEVRHFVGGDDLIILTGGSEWKVNAGGEASFSPDTIKQDPQDELGASHNMPAVLDRTVVYVRENKSEVRGIAYSLTEDGYITDNLSLMASHLFRRYKIIDSASARSPDPLIIYPREDGKAGVMTFNKMQEVVAWSTWDTLGGKLESVAAIRPNLGMDTDDAAYFVVRRKVDGRTVRYIERTASRKFHDVRDCFFVDSGLTLDRPVDITNITAANPVAVTAASHGFSNGDLVDIHDVVWEPDYDDEFTETQPDQLNRRRFKVANATANTFEITTSSGTAIDGTDFSAYREDGTVRLTVQSVGGLWSLEGREVAVLADGNVVNGLVVEDGSITLPFRASRVHVGLRMIADIETLNVERQDQTLQGKKKSIPHVIVRVEDSRGLLIGPELGKLAEWIQRTDEEWGDPTRLFTGDVPLPLESDWNSNGRFFIRQKEPLPLTVLAVVPYVVMEEDDA